MFQYNNSHWLPFKAFFNREIIVKTKQCNLLSPAARDGISPRLHHCQFSHTFSPFPGHFLWWCPDTTADPWLPQWYWSPGDQRSGTCSCPAHLQTKIMMINILISNKKKCFQHNTPRKFISPWWEEGSGTRGIEYHFVESWRFHQTPYDIMGEMVNFIKATSTKKKQNVLQYVIKILIAVFSIVPNSNSCLLYYLYIKSNQTSQKFTKKMYLERYCR